MELKKRFSQSEGKSFDIYLQEITKINLLTPEEEIKLAKKIREDGDEVAKEKLVKANLKFVVTIAKQYQNFGIPLVDLINEGNLGLIKAAEKFDETRGFKFISYAVWWIRQSILQALSDQSRTVRIPSNKAAEIIEIKKRTEKLAQELNREPNSDEIAEAMGKTEEAVKDILTRGKRSLSLNASRDPSEKENTVFGTKGSLADTISNEESPPPDASLMQESVKQSIQRALSHLPEMEQEIISLYFGLDKDPPMTLEEIGSKFDLTRERIRQIKENILRKIRTNSKLRRILEVENPLSGSHLPKKKKDPPSSQEKPNEPPPKKISHEKENDLSSSEEKYTPDWQLEIENILTFLGEKIIIISEPIQQAVLEVCREEKIVQEAAKNHDVSETELRTILTMMAQKSKQVSSKKVRNILSPFLAGEKTK